jgi:NitT/TauT family transport system substrate-binding protein
MMRRFVPLLAAVVLFGGVSVASAQSVVKLASAQNSVGSLPIYVAEMQGFFAEQGVKVEILDFKGGGPAVQALAGGSVDFCICAGDHAVRLRSRGLPAKIAAGLTEQHGYGLLALASSPVTDIASMKGKKLGITSPGSLTDNTVRFSIKQAKLDPDRDVVLASVGTGVPMKAALDSGAIDAGMFTTPDVQSNLAQPGKYKVVQDYRTLGYPALDLIALDSWLQKNDKAARGFLAAIVKAEQLLQTDPEATRKGIKKMFPTFDDKLVDLLVDDVPKHLSRKGEVDKAGFDTMIEMLGASEPELKSVPFADVVSSAYLPGK